MDGDVGYRYLGDWKGPKSHVFFVFDNHASEKGLRRWMLRNTSLGWDELNFMKRYSLSAGHLSLSLDNGEDPLIVSYVWSMDPKQLDYFRRFEPTDLGHRELMELGARWIQQAEFFDKPGSDSEFLRRYRGEAVTLSARARAYWVLANRHRAEELWTAGEDSRSPEFAEYYKGLGRAA